MDDKEYQKFINDDLKPKYNYDLNLKYNSGDDKLKHLRFLYESE